MREKRYRRRCGGVIIVVLSTAGAPWRIATPWTAGDLAGPAGVGEGGREDRPAVVAADKEKEIREASIWRLPCAGRSEGEDARGPYFFETLVRVHREGREPPTRG